MISIEGRFKISPGICGKFERYPKSTAGTENSSFTWPPCLSDPYDLTFRLPSFSITVPIYELAHPQNPLMAHVACRLWFHSNFGFRNLEFIACRPMFSIKWKDGVLPSLKPKASGNRSLPSDLHGASPNKRSLFRGHMSPPPCKGWYLPKSHSYGRLGYLNKWQGLRLFRIAYGIPDIYTFYSRYRYNISYIGMVYGFSL